MKESCFPIKIIKINLNTNNIQVHELAPFTSVCYSNLTVEGKKVIIPNNVPLNGTVVTVKNNKIKVYLFYRSIISIPTILRGSQTQYLFSKVENCLPSLETHTIPAGASNIQFLLIGPGGEGGEGGNGGAGFGNNGGGGGGGSSGSPGTAGSAVPYYIDKAETEIVFKFRTGVSEAGCKYAPAKRTELILPGLEHPIRALGGVFGINGRNGGASKGYEPGAGGLPPTKGYAGGEGGHGSKHLAPPHPTVPAKDGENGEGLYGGSGGSAETNSIFESTGGGGGGGSGIGGGIIYFANGYITHTPEQLPVTKGGNGASGASRRDGNGGYDAPNVEGETPYGFGGNSGGGGGGGGGTTLGYAGGGGGLGGKGTLGGKGVLILYYEI